MFDIEVRGWKKKIKRWGEGRKEKKDTKKVEEKRRSEGGWHEGGDDKYRGDVRRKSLKVG